MKVAGFDWDDANIEKCQKHGLSVSEIEELFYGEVLVRADLVHSVSEERFIAIGRLGNGRAAFVVFALRSDTGRTLIRPISARYMHEKEVKRYEETVAKVQNRRRS